MTDNHNEDSPSTGNQQPGDSGPAKQHAESSAGQPFPGQPYAGQPYGGQPYAGQPYGPQSWGPGPVQQPHPQPAPYAIPGAPPPPQPYPGQPFGQPPGAPLPGAPQPVWVPPVPVYPYAPWARRVGAWLIDFAPALIAQIPFWIGYVMFNVRLIQLSATASTTAPDELFADLAGAPLVWMAVGFVLVLAAFGWQWYNRWLLAGRTGQSMGKRMLDSTLVAEINGQPIGPVNAFLRDLLHVLDGVAYIGYLWPLWDAKRQTFSDMIMKTVVVDQRGHHGSSPVAHADHHPATGGAA